MNFPLWCWWTLELSPSDLWHRGRTGPVCKLKTTSENGRPTLRHSKDLKGSKVKTWWAWEQWGFSPVAWPAQSAGNCPKQPGGFSGWQITSRHDPTSDPTSPTWSNWSRRAHDLTTWLHHFGVQKARLEVSKSLLQLQTSHILSKPLPRNGKNWNSGWLLKNVYIYIYNYIYMYIEAFETKWQIKGSLSLCNQCCNEIGSKQSSCTQTVTLFDANTVWPELLQCFHQWQLPI